MTNFHLGKSIIKQDDPRGRIVELQRHQDGLNSQSYNGLQTPIMSAHVYESFQVSSRFEHGSESLWITRPTHRKSCLIIIVPNSHDKYTKS